MKRFKKIVFTLFILGITTPHFSYGTDFKESCTHLFEWKDKLNNILVYNKDVKNIKDLTQHFCEKAQTLKCSDDSDWDYIIDYFDASQSIFLSVLCESVWKWAWYNQTKSNLKKQDFVDFGIVSSHTWYRESCDRHYWSMNECDYSYNIPLIFNKIMNDFFSIKQAQNFWITWLNTPFFSETPANNFSLKYFPWLSIMLGDKEKTLIGICDPNNKYYKTTCKKLKWYMTDANNLLRNTEVVDIDKLQWKKPEDIDDCENKFYENILYCGLLWNDSYYKFLNTVYNEYFRYKLFLSYYSFYINGTDFLDANKLTDIDKLQKNQEKIFLTQDQLLKSKQGISMSFQSLSEINYSFPLHVWFLMYYEDVEYFMKNIAKIYTPIRTLYDKLRNVQIKEE